VGLVVGMSVAVGVVVVGTHEVWINDVAIMGAEVIVMTDFVHVREVVTNVSAIEVHVGSGVSESIITGYDS
jgi:hypothetical protein